MGTSIPAGQGISGKNYPTQIAELLSCTIQNNAVPGLALEGNLNDGVWTPKSMGSASLTLAEYAAAGITSPGNKCYENNMLGKNADLYVFDCEPNNTNADTTILNNFNVNTWSYTGELAGTTLAGHRDCYVGCLLYLLDKLWTEKPDAKVVFVGEHTSCTDFSQNYAMSEASAALAEKLRIPYIDLAEKLYYNKYNVGVYVNSDKIHPTQAGHDRIAKILANELLLIA